MNPNTKAVATLGVSLALALILSYIEVLIPPMVSAVPGIKIGLANIITLFLLYRLGAREAITVAASRVVLAALLFGSALSLAYSASGAALAIAVMIILRASGRFSAVGVSIGGAVAHNVGQVVCAVIILGTREIGYYAVVLSVSGVLSGIFVGIAGALLLRHIKRI